MTKINTALVQQSLTLVSVFVNTFMYGCATSWISNAIIFLTKPGHIPSASVEQCGLIAQFFEAGRLIFAIPGGLLVDKYGRKKILIGIGALNLISWMVLCFTDSLLLIYAARFLMGIAVALLYVSAYSMIGEIASPEYRGTLTSINEFANMSGQLFESIVMVMAKTYLALAAYTSLVAVLFFSTIFWLIESPLYLANMADFETAKNNLKVIRPDYKDEQVDQEFNFLLQSIAEEKQKKDQVNWFNFYKVKTFRKSLQCVLLLNTVAVTCGGPVISLYVAVMLPPNSYFESSYYTFIIFSMQFVAAIGSIFVLDKFPRRQLYLASALISIVMHLLNVITYTLFSITGSDLWKWIFILNNFLYMLIDRGLISPCNCTVRSEIFPHSLKGIGNALSVICQAVSLIISYQIYEFVFAYFGLAANYAIFAVNSALLAVIIYFLLPEMGGKSLAEVQNDIGERIHENARFMSKKVAYT